MARSVYVLDRCRLSLYVVKETSIVNTLSGNFTRARGTEPSSRPQLLPLLNALEVVRHLSCEHHH